MRVKFLAQRNNRSLWWGLKLMTDRHPSIMLPTVSCHFQLLIPHMRNPTQNHEPIHTILSDNFFNKKFGAVFLRNAESCVGDYARTRTVSLITKGYNTLSHTTHYFSWNGSDLNILNRILQLRKVSSVSAHMLRRSCTYKRYGQTDRRMNGRTGWFL